MKLITNILHVNPQNIHPAIPPIFKFQPEKPVGDYNFHNVMRKYV